MKSRLYKPHIQSRKEKSEAINNVDFKAHRWVVARTHSWMNPLPPGSDTLGKEGRK
ncbi:putative transposase [Pectobacterium brasiliense ICMP 19477]|nr:putative transposase [Pectobacterium brasiliense ICMP 19477]